jgi:hypothetical protein
VGGDSWQYSNKGKHQLVRDLVLLTCIADEASVQHSIPAPASDTSAAAAAAAAAPGASTDGDQDMQDAAAATAVNEAGVVEDAVGPVSPQELVQAARVLLLLLLQLYSSCEEVGMYGQATGGEGRRHMQRLQGGAGQPNDR